MAVTKTTNSGSIYAEYDTVKETFPESKVSSTALEGQALTLNTLVGGTGYTAATDVPTTGGTGTGLTVDITVSGGVIQTATINQAGLGYAASDTVTITTGNADATVDVATVSNNLVSVANRMVTGNYAKFATEFQKGDYIWLKDNDELRRIETVSSDNVLILEHAATTDASTEYAVVNRMGFNSVSYLVDDVGTAEINGIAVPKNSSESFRTDLKFIPILIDTVTNSNKVIVSAKTT